LSEYAFQNKDQLTFDSLFDELTKDDSQEEPEKNIRFIKQQRKNFPMQLAADFNQFMKFIGHQSLPLTESYISDSHLSAINERMSIREINGTDQTKQGCYPYIHFFYHIALSGNLLKIETSHSEELELKTTDRWGLYLDLTDTEQYFFLFETFWIDVDWAKLLQKDFNPIHYMLPEVFSKITEPKSKSVLDFQEKETLLGHLISNWNDFFLYMEWFGFWVCEKDQKRSFVKKLTATPFGLSMISVLLNSRDIKVWNVPLRQEFGESSPVPGSTLPEMGKPRNNSQALQPFYKAFKTLFPKNDLQDTLPRTWKR
jgi:shikimate kinase